MATSPQFAANWGQDRLQLQDEFAALLEDTLSLSLYLIPTATVRLIYEFLTGRLLTERLLTERLLTERLLTERLLTERLLTERLLTERLLTERWGFLCALRVSAFQMVLNRGMCETQSRRERRACG